MTPWRCPRCDRVVVRVPHGLEECDGALHVETDDRWIADAVDVPGATRDDAIGVVIGIVSTAFVDPPSPPEPAPALEVKP